jgi:hypothetical protein
MREPPKERLLVGQGFERVYAELDWYDGPRHGVAQIDGVAHYFRAVQDYNRVGFPDNEYLVWPLGESVLALEREQWAIFVDWAKTAREGTADADTHPGLGGVNRRYDELTTLLASHREVPADARRLTATWRGASGIHEDGNGPAMSSAGICADRMS